MYEKKLGDYKSKYLKYKNKYINLLGGKKGSHAGRTCYRPKLHFSSYNREDNVWEGQTFTGNDVCHQGRDHTMRLSTDEQQELAQQIVDESDDLRTEYGIGKYKYDDNVPRGDVNTHFYPPWLKKTRDQAGEASGRQIKMVSNKGRNKDKGFYIYSHAGR